MKNSSTVVVQQVDSASQPAPLTRTRSGTQQNKQKSASTFMDTCTQAEANSITKAIAAFFYRCNIAFRVVDSHAFRKFISLLRPAYASKFLFHRDKLCTTLLDQQYEELMSVLLAQVKKSKYFVLACDGYETSDGRHFVDVVIHTPGNPALMYKAVDTTAMSLNKKAMIDILTTCATELGVEKWLGSVLDNASVNVATEKAIETEHPRVFVNGCAVHSYDLIIENFGDHVAFNSTFQQCHCIIHMVQRHQHVRQTYNDIKTRFGVKHKIIEPGNTRFKTNVIMARSIMENKSVLRELVDTHCDTVRKCSAKSAVKDSFIDLINSHGFWADLAMALDFFEPIADILTNAESDTYFIEEVYTDMLKVFEHVSHFNFKGKMDKKEAQQICLRRWNFLHSDTMGFAFILNPITAGKGMLKMRSPLDNSKIDDYRETMKDLREFLILYYSNPEEAKQAAKEIDFFAQEFSDVDKEYVEKYANSNPRAYWAQHGRRNYPTLCKLADRLFQMPAGAISSERVWSAFSFVYSKARNQLSSETLMKLVFIYVNSKLLDQEDRADYTNEEDFFGMS